MIFSHYSKTPVGPLELKRQHPDRFGLKPDGLWVSVDGEDDWPHWCQANDYDGCGPYHYRVRLDLERVLMLDTNDALRAFHQRWSAAGPLPGYARYDYIDWEAVTREYAGVIIAPYQWDSRLDLLWYYGWDCASGCVWDPAAVIGLEQVPSTTNADNRARSQP